MADQFKEVTKKGYGSRIVDSIKGIGIGLLLFLAAFAVLYKNEGRVNKAEIAATAMDISADQASPEAEGKLVSVSGTVLTEETLGDGLYVKPGDYLAVSRNVEMFAWVEKSSSTSDTNFGGSETTETTYTYAKEWTSLPASSSSFRYPEGHQNPSKTVDSDTVTVSSAKIGVYNLDISKLQLPGYSPLTLNEEVIELKGNAAINGQYIYVPVSGTPAATTTTPTTTTTTTTAEDDFFTDTPEATETLATPEEDDFFEDTTSEETTTATSGITNPQVGDVRISYTVLRNNVQGTVMGKLEGDRIVTFVDFENDNAQLYRLFSGSRDEAVSQLDSEHSFMTWVLRALGFLMMWIGLSALFAPISVLLDVVPFLGSLSRAAVGTITFLTALILAIVTIIVSMIVHSVLALIIVMVAGLAIFIFYLKMKGKKGAKKSTS